MKSKLLYASAIAAAFSVMPTMAILANEGDATPDNLETLEVTDNTGSPTEGNLNPTGGAAGPAAISDDDIENPEEGTEDSVTVEAIVANTSVGDGQREVNSFEITVDNIEAVKDVTAADFTILNNVATTVYDKETGTFLEDMEDDGITLSIAGNTITLNVTPFSYPGMYNADFSRSPWEVICTKYNELSFTANDVTELKTSILDDAIRGTFEYAGIEREYALYLPKDEDGNVIMNSSLVLWNHGGGEYAGDLEATLVANKGFTAWVEQGYPTAVVEFQISNANYSYYTAADATEESGGTAEEKAERRKLIDQNNALQAAFIRQLIADGYVDADRVYITGASSGGGATMRFVMQYPELVAGAIAISSHDPIVWVHKNPDAELESLTANSKKPSRELYTLGMKQASLWLKNKLTHKL